jgi:hypothetical protein
MHRTNDLTVRYAGPADLDALTRLAALDGVRAPQGPALLAESNTRVIAALPFGAGRPIADPFERSADAVALLELRASQLRAAERPQRRTLRARVRRLLPRPA